MKHYETTWNPMCKHTTNKLATQNIIKPWPTFLQASFIHSFWREQLGQKHSQETQTGTQILRTASHVGPVGPKMKPDDYCLKPCESAKNSSMSELRNTRNGRNEAVLALSNEQQKLTFYYRGALANHCGIIWCGWASTIVILPSRSSSSLLGKEAEIS